MAFWAAKEMEPKRKFRWKLSFGNNKNFIDCFVVKKAGRPSFTQTEAIHEFLNHTFYFPGRLKWDELTITLADVIDPNGAAAILGLIRQAGYQLPVNPNVLSTVSKNDAVTSLNGISLVQIDSDGNPIEVWKLTNPWIKNVKFAENDYSSDDIQEIELTFRFDFAQLVQLQSGLHEGPAPSEAGKG